MVPGRGEERETRREKHACALYGDQPPIWYEMYAAYTGNRIQQGQMPIIMIVYRHNGCSQKEIAEWMGVTPPTVNVSIQRLEKADIVCRKRDDKDQRIMRVYLTENGRKIVEGAPAGKQSCGESDVQQFQRSGAMSFTKVFGQILDNISEIPVNR